MKLAALVLLGLGGASPQQVHELVKESAYSLAGLVYKCGSHNRQDFYLRYDDNNHNGVDSADKLVLLVGNGVKDIPYGDFGNQYTSFDVNTGDIFTDPNIWYKIERARIKAEQLVMDRGRCSR
jgi:hypothetical protein